MWCSTCQQDVPGRAANDSGSGLCCPRCGRGLGGDRREPTGDAAAIPEEKAAGEPGAGLPVYDGWELDQQLRHAQSLLQTARGGSRGREAAYQQEVTRVDGPHVASRPWHPATAAKSAQRKRAKSPQPSGAIGVLTWAVLSLGTMALACGGILLGWSLVTDRAELWGIGLPIALGGQVTLLLGLILQLERLWHDSRRASAKLDTVDEQLSELKTTTTLLGTTHSSSASTFYSHLADGAAPQLLLSDLKSQLDLLALKMGREEQ